MGCLNFNACGNNQSEGENVQESKTEDSSTLSEVEYILSEIETEGKQEVVEVDECEKITGQYFIQKLYEEDTINVNDKIWVLATDMTNEFEAVNYYLLVDLEGDIYAKIEEKYGMQWENSIGETMIVLEDKNSENLHIYDVQGNDLTYKWCNEDDEQVIVVAEDATGYTIWTRNTKQTFETYDVFFRAYDEFGTIKKEWSSEQTKNEMAFLAVYFMSDYKDRKPIYLGGVNILLT